jgi:hypothetical protein
MVVMQTSLFHEKYPIYSITYDKSEISQSSVDELIEYFKGKIEEHPKAGFISTFDHYAHTTKINGDINPDIKAAKHVIFCFGMKLDGPGAMAVRPRSIGVTDLGDQFVINFMEAPNPVANEAMEGWVKALKN